MEEVVVLFEEAAEIAEASIHTVNLYLDAGYQLISVQPKSRAVAHSRQEGEGKRVQTVPMVLRSVCYVVGRTSAVPHYEPPSRAERVAAEQAAAG